MRLNLDLWHDEIYTLTTFVAAGPRQIVTDYSAPNNHVLYSLLLWPVHLLSDGNFALRLPSLIFAVGTLWMTFRAGCRLGDAKLGVFATLLLGLNQMFLIHAIQVRGYGLSMFLFAWLVCLAIANGGAVRFSRLVRIAVVGAAFLYVMPTNLLSFLPLAALALAWPPRPTADEGTADGRMAVGWTAAARRLKAAGIAWAAALGLAALCYAPIARQVLERRGEPTPFMPAALLASIADFLRPATHDLLPLAPFFLLGLTVWVWRRLRRSGAASPAAPLLAAGVFAGSFLLAAGLGIGPFPRNFCPLLPLLALVQAWTLGELASAVRWKNERGELAAAAASALVIVVVLAPQLATYPRRLAAYCREHRGAHDGYFNYYAADYRVADAVERIKELTAGGRPFRVCYATEDHWNLNYYFQRAGQPLARRAAIGKADASIYVIAPVQADWADIAARHELPAEELRKLPLIEKFGYYVLKGGKMKDEIGRPAQSPTTNHQSPTMLVETRSLAKRYGDVTALKNCALQIERGEVYGLLGPNGSGKTTLIRLLMGFLRPTAGSAWIDGLDCYRQSVAVHARVAYLPGDARLFRQMRGREVLRFFCGVRAGADFRKALELAERLKLELSRKVSMLSTGMRQKLALAAVLAADTPLAILDEPTANLDPNVRNDVLALVREARSAGRTVIFSSHVLDEAEQACDRVGILREGELVHVERVAEVRRQHRIRARLTGPLPEPPAALARQLTIAASNGRLAIHTPGELSPLLGWLATLPLAEVRIEPLGLKAVYESYHPPQSGNGLDASADDAVRPQGARA